MAARKWNPFGDILIGSPGSAYLLPAICLDEFESVAARHYRIKIRINIGLMLVWIIFSTILAYLSKQKLDTTDLTIFVSLIVATIAIDDIFFLSNNDNLRDRGRYLYSLIHNSRVKKIFFSILVIGIIVGGFQLMLEEAVGGLEMLIRKYGITYVEIEAGQWWRLVTGPFFHSSVAHFMSNIAFCLVCAPFVGIYLGWASVFIYLFSSVLGTLAWMIASHGDALAGISGGVFGLAGAMYGISIYLRNELPKGLGVQLGLVGLISIVGAELLNPVAATTCHIFGYLGGFVTSILIMMYRKHPSTISANTEE